MLKKMTFGFMVLVLVLPLLVGCQAQPTETPVVEVAPEEAVSLTVAIVAGGEIGDKGFVDSANEGLLQLEEEFGINTLMLQGRDEPDRYLDLLITAGEEADLVFVVPGYFFEEQLAEVVPQFPDTTFVYVDGITSLEGMSSIRYLEHEGSFLAGALAALLTERTDVLDLVDAETVIGEMGGADMPVIHNFMVGSNRELSTSTPTSPSSPVSPERILTRPPGERRH